MILHHTSHALKGHPVPCLSLLLTRIPIHLWEASRMQWMCGVMQQTSYMNRSSCTASTLCLGSLLLPLQAVPRCRHPCHDHDKFLFSFFVTSSFMSLLLLGYDSHWLWAYSNNSVHSALHVQCRELMLFTLTVSPAPASFCASTKLSCGLLSEHLGIACGAHFLNVWCL
jgi:hypothetical protein